MNAFPQTNWLDLVPPGHLTPLLTEEEQDALVQRKIYHQAHRYGSVAECQKQHLGRLVAPFNLIHARVGGCQDEYQLALNTLMTEMHQRQTPWWIWHEEGWCQILSTSRTKFSQRYGHRSNGSSGRLLVLACAYVPGNFSAFPQYGFLEPIFFAKRVFGAEPVQVATQRVATQMKQMGMGQSLIQTSMPIVLAYAMLLARSTHLDDLSTDLLRRVRLEMSPSPRRSCVPLSRALYQLGVLAQPLELSPMGCRPRAGVNDAVSTEWVSWCERWRAASTLVAQCRDAKVAVLLKVGRWLMVQHPQITSPEQWSRDLAAQWVAAVDRMVVGEWNHPQAAAHPLADKPLMSNTKCTYIATVRAFFFDCQRWGWIPVRFDPQRSMITPRSLKAQRGPNPRVIADDIWAKLMSAGLTLAETDLPLCLHQVLPKGHPAKAQRVGQPQPQPWYPLELVRAITLTWLFGGLRANEIKRLRVGCVRWQAPDASALSNSPDNRPVCLLEVPVNKTSRSFVKPVDRLMGEAIQAWEQVRPASLASWDTKTGETVQFLFMYKGKRIGNAYLNTTLIPMLCRKAGVPEKDARGSITSHRARSTIATQLYNAREPMSLFELQAWLGHHSPDSTQYYAQITPTKLTTAYRDAGYFDRNVRMIEVLLDQDAIQSGAAANGEPWKYYDLGHGYCTYDFFDHCPHRMACAKCSFYRPKTSSRDQLLEGKASLQRMLQVIPLLEDERAAIEDSVGAMDALLQRLVNLPMPDGQLPTESTTLSPLPLIN